MKVKRIATCAALLTISVALLAQSPAFEAASICPRVGEAQGPPSSPTRFANADATLAFLVSFAYRVNEFQIVGWGSADPWRLS